jgi:hypothetical protein
MEAVLGIRKVVDTASVESQQLHHLDHSSFDSFNPKTILARLLILAACGGKDKPVTELMAAKDPELFAVAKNADLSMNMSSKESSILPR